MYYIKTNQLGFNIDLILKKDLRLLPIFFYLLYLLYVCVSF
jgi:hypothetical protein